MLSCFACAQEVYHHTGEMY